MSTLSHRRAAVARTASFRGIGAYLDLWRQRQHLHRLDADALKDLGLSRNAAERESPRAIWDAPAHWHA